jgi:ribosomal protein L40E
MTETLNIQCPSCQSNLVVEADPGEWAGQTIECPDCHAAIAIPSAGGTPSQCPSCNADLAEDAVVCVACGYDLRTGQKISLEEDDASPPVKMESRRRTIFCNRCGAEMFADATTCPACHCLQREGGGPFPGAESGRGRFGVLRTVVIVLLLLGIVLFVLFAVVLPKRSKPARGRPAPTKQQMKDPGKSDKGVSEGRKSAEIPARR